MAGSGPADLLAVLLFARGLLTTCGWVRGEYLVEAHASVPRERRSEDPYTLIDALWSAPVTVARVEARTLLQRIAGHPNLLTWNAHPYRHARDVEALLDDAIRELGGIPPAERIHEAGAPRRRGGWTVTTPTQRSDPMKPKQQPSKECPHKETRWPQPVNGRVLAACAQCGRLVPVEAAK